MTKEEVIQILDDLIDEKLQEYLAAKAEGFYSISAHVFYARDGVINAKYRILQEYEKKGEV